MNLYVYRRISQFFMAIILVATLISCELRYDVSIDLDSGTKLSFVESISQNLGPGAVLFIDLSPEEDEVSDSIEYRSKDLNTHPDIWVCHHSRTLYHPNRPTPPPRLLSF